METCMFLQMNDSPLSCDHDLFFVPDESCLSNIVIACVLRNRMSLCSFKWELA